MMRRLFLTILVLLLTTGAARAQTASVTVRIAVTHDNEPVAGADVQLGNVSAITNDEGVAVLRAEAGRKELRVRRLGFAEVTRIVEIANRDESLVVELELAAEELEEIVVLSTRSGKRIEEQPTRVEVLAAEEIEEKTMMTPGDVAMLLNETSGLRVQITSPSLAAANVRIQGLRGRYTQLLADGLPLYGGQSGALGLLQIPPVDLGQVEVIKGAASALYGSSALGGVINLISRRPDGQRELLLNQTSLNGSDAVLWLSGDNDRSLQYTVTAGGHRQAGADIDDDGWLDLPEYQRALLRPRLFWKSPHGHSAYITAGGTWESRSGGGVEPSQNQSIVEAVDTRRGDIGGVATLRIADNRLLTLRGSAMLQAHDHTYDTVREHDRHRTGFGEITFATSTGAHTWLVGAAMQHDGYRSRDVPRFDYNFNTPSVFAQDEFSVGDRWTGSVSARADHHSRYGTFVTPRVALLFRPADGWSVRAAGGGGYFAPTPFTEETEAIGLMRLRAIDDLEAERATTLSLDVNHERGPVELNATLFASLLDHAVRLRPASDGMVELVNAPDITRTRGIELLARWHTEGFHATATYVFTHATEPHEAGVGRRTVPLTPRHTFGVVAMREYEGRGRIAAELYYTGVQELEDNPYRTRSKPYVVTGMLGEWRWGRIRFFLNAENLLNARQSEYHPLVRTTPSSEGRWTVDAWAPLEGRVFNAGIRASW